MPEIHIAKFAGACYGVERALGMVNACLEESSSVCTLGPLIHNPRVVAELSDRGAHPVEAVNEVLPGETLVIRSHGVPPAVVDEAQKRKLRVIDATCPHVKKAHEAASQLAQDGYQVVVVGEAGHPEVEGILARAGQHALAACTVENLERASIGRRVGIVVQTTQSAETLQLVVSWLLPRVRELKIMNTICAATAHRQSAAAALAASMDVMIVVGGKNSGNTRRLVEVCSVPCRATYHVETPDDISVSWFKGASDIGITAGASTPAGQIDEVIERIRSLIQQEDA